MKVMRFTDGSVPSETPSVVALEHQETQVAQSLRSHVHRAPPAAANPVCGGRRLMSIREVVQQQNATKTNKTYTYIHAVLLCGLPILWQ